NTYSGACLAGGRQRELAPPPREQRGAERAVGRFGELAVARDDGARLAARLLEQVRVAEQIDCAELGEPRLARAEELARAAQLQIDLGDAEAVVRRRHRVDPALGLFREMAGRQQDAVRLPLAPSHASAKLMQLRETEALGVLD